MIKEGKVIIILCIFALSTLFISGCGPQKSPGDVNITILAGMDAGWNEQYYEINFGTANRCEVVNSEGFPHGLEVRNDGLTPVNIDIRSTDDLLTDPLSNWKFKAECYAMGRSTGSLFGFAGNCWDGDGGSEGIQDTYIDIPSSDANVVACLNYRSSEASTSPGVRIDVELTVSCQEPAEEKYGLLAVTFEEAVPATDCGGDSGFDPGGV
jgi:hypothetical protein